MESIEIQRGAVETTLDAHWLSIGGAEDVPYRSHLDPKSIHSALEHLILLQVEEQGPTRIRIGGLSVCNLLGQEARGVPVRALFASDQDLEIESIVARCINGPSALDVELVSERGGVEALMTLRPLRDGLGAINRIVGTLVTACEPSERRQHFRVRSVVERQFAGNFVPIRTAELPPPLQLAGLGEAGVPFVREIPGKTNTQLRSAPRGKLRLVSSQD